MPQIFQVLKCYKCLIFQVHLTKKSNKWECKMCGEKQSIKRHYGIGTAQECRGHVQRLNEMQGNKTESIIKNVKSDDDDDDDLQTCKKTLQKIYANKKLKIQSKWAKFIEEEEDIPNAVNEVESCEETGVLEVTKKRKPFKRPKEISNCNEYTKIEFLNKKLCHLDSQSKQCNSSENYKIWSTNMHENKESASESSKTSLNANPKIRCNRLTELDSSQFTTKTEIKDIEYNEERNYKDIHIARNIDTVHDSNLENITDQSQFLKSEDGNKGAIIESKTRTLFSLCNDNDIDSILDC